MIGTRTTNLSFDRSRRVTSRSALNDMPWPVDVVATQISRFFPATGLLNTNATPVIDFKLKSHDVLCDMVKSSLKRLTAVSAVTWKLGAVHLQSTPKTTSDTLPVPAATVKVNAPLVPAP